MAGRQLVLLRNSDEPLFARVMAQIKAHITSWSPGLEDGVLIKHAASISRECNHDVYRLKSPPYIQKWRVFFTLLDGKTPPQRLVLAIVEYENDQQCYDDKSQLHFVEIRNMILSRAFSGEIKPKRRK